MLNVSPETHQALGLCIAALALLVYALPLRRNLAGGIFVLFLIVAVFAVAPVLDTRRENMLAAERLFIVVANPAVVVLIGLAILGRAARETGLIATLFQPTHGQDGNAARRMARLFMAAIVGAFIPTASTVAGYAASIAPHSDEAQGDSVWPISVAALAGGAVLLVTAGPLLVAAGTLWTLGRRPFAPLDLTLPAFCALGAVLLLLVLREAVVGNAATRGPRPHRRRNTDEAVLARVRVGADARYLTATLQGERLSALPDLIVRGRIRGESIRTPPFYQDDIETGDILIVAGSVATIAPLTDDPHVTIDHIRGPAAAETDSRMVPLVVPIGSNLIGRTVIELALTPRFDLLPLDIGRGGRWLGAKAPATPLEANDIVLVHGEPRSIDRAREALDIVPATPPRLGSSGARAFVAATILGAFALCASGTVGMATAFAGAAALALLAGTVPLRHALRDLDSGQFIAAIATLGVALVLFDTAAMDAVLPQAIARAPALPTWQWLGIAAIAGAVLAAFSHPYMVAGIGVTFLLALGQRAEFEVGPFIGAFALGCTCRFLVSRYEPALGLGIAFGHSSAGARTGLGFLMTLLAAAAGAAALVGIAHAVKP